MLLPRGLIQDAAALRGVCISVTFGKIDVT